jgi:dihydroflavonol-4-reductase
MVNAANVFSLDVREAERMRQVNQAGTEVALTAAVEGGLSTVVHVSSYVALLPSTVPLTSASATGSPEGPTSSPRQTANGSPSGCASRAPRSS